MNIQTEHLDNHTARLTVEVEPARVQKAMETAARRISQKANIPGFRRGKAPYKIIMRYVGAEGLLEEAIEDLGDSVYQQALAESGVNPYAMGRLDKIEPEALDSEPKLKLTFTVPKVPDVELNAYREVRLPWEAPEVADDDVSQTIKRAQEREALVEPASRPAQMGDKVKFKLSGTIEHHHTEPAATEATEKPEGESSEAAAQAPEAEAHDEHDHDEHDHHDHTDTIAEDEIEMILRTDDEDMVPGFSEQLVGLGAGESKEFTLDFANDHPKADYAGHTYQFKVELETVQSVTLPALNDDFAKKVTDNAVDNLLDYRIKVRKDLQEAANQRAENEYADSILDKVVEGATFKYPDVIVEEYIDDIIKELEASFKDRGLSLEDFMRLEGKDKDSLREGYRDIAINRLKRSLALGKVVETEKIRAETEDVDAEIDRMAQQFGEQAELFKGMLNRPETRRNLLLDLIKNNALKRLAAIGRGENPPIPADADETPSADALLIPEATPTQAEPPAPESAQPEANVAEQPSESSQAAPQSSES